MGTIYMDTTRKSSDLFEVWRKKRYVIEDGWFLDRYCRCPIQNNKQDG
jgi:hypothetical protein